MFVLTKVGFIINAKKTDFINIPNRITIFNRIKNSEITLEEAKRFREISIEL